MKTTKRLLLVLLLPCMGCPSEPQPSEDVATQDTVDASSVDVGADGSVDTAIEDTGPTCPDPATTERPQGLSEIFGAMDVKRRKLVFFGGNQGVPVNCSTATHHISDVWVYDTVCASFERVETAGGPGPRARGMAIYDPDRDQIVIYGGRYKPACQLDSDCDAGVKCDAQEKQKEWGNCKVSYTVYDDAWTLNLETFEWAKIAWQGAGPQGRSNPAGGYNSLTGEMVIFGGNASNDGAVFNPLNDVWALDLEKHTWRYIATQGSAPSMRLFHAAAVDPDQKRLFIYGGGGANAWFGPFLGDLWMMNLETGAWELLHDGGIGAPKGRIWPTLTWDSYGQRLLLFGGHDDGSLGNNNDTWSFDPQTKSWTVLIEPEEIFTPFNGFCDFPKDFTFPNMAAPERRSGHLAALDETRGEWVVFGGKTDCGLIDDVWLFLLGQDSWAQLIDATVGETCTRGDQPQLCVALCK